MHGNAVESGIDIDDDYDDGDDDLFDIRKIHGHVVEPDTDIDDCNYDFKEFSAVRFHGVSKNYKRVYDHFHYTGKYRGTAHSICNLRYKKPKAIPVVFGNGSNND